MKGERVAYDLTGTEPAPVLVLLASLGTDRRVWEAQVPAFSSWFRVLRIDHPGHYGPSAPMGARSLEALGERIIGVLDSLDVESAHFAGLSLGGLIAMKLAIDHPGRVARLAVCCSAPRFAPSGMWVERAEKVRAEGIAPLVEAALGRWFGPAFWRHHPEVVARYRSMLSGVDPEGYASCCDALAAADVSGQLGQITAPTLVLGGAHDPVVPPESAAGTMAAIPGASLCVLAGAAHLANVEQPGAFNSAVLAHLAGRPDERGVAVRRAVLGADHVERSMSGASELTAPFQEMLNLWPWGEVWAARPRRRNATAHRDRHTGGPGTPRRTGDAPPSGTAGGHQLDRATRTTAANGRLRRRPGGQFRLCYRRPCVDGGHEKCGRGLGRR